MNCAEFAARLEKFAAGELSATDRLAAARHLDGCGWCRALADAVRAEIAPAPVEPDADLTRAILERTSGPACPEAERRLGALVDGMLAGADAEIVRLHLDHCRACGALAEALAFTTQALPSLAEIDPGPRFLAQVMEATARRRPIAGDRAGVAARPGGRLAGLKTAARAFVARPRFALEAAYGGALVAWLLFGAPAAPWREAPERALALARVNPVQALNASALAVPDWLARPVAAGRRLLDEAGAPVLARAAPVRSDWRRRAHEVEEIWPALRAEMGALLSAASAGDVIRGAAHMRAIGAHLGRLFDVFLERNNAEGSATREV